MDKINIGFDLFIKTNNSKRIEKYLKIARSSETFVFDNINYKIVNIEVVEYSNSRTGMFMFREINSILNNKKEKK